MLQDFQNVLHWIPRLKGLEAVYKLNYILMLVIIINLTSLVHPWEYWPFVNLYLHVITVTISAHPSNTISNNLKIFYYKHDGTYVHVRIIAAVSDHIKLKVWEEHGPAKLRSAWPISQKIDLQSPADYLKR